MKEKRRNRSMYHWVILVCCILTLMFSYSTRFGLSQLFVTEIIKETGFATSAYFLSATVASVICVFTGSIAGKLLRGKYMRRTFLICCIGTMGFYSCYGLCNELWQFYLVGALQGLFAMGACTMPVTVLITNWFDKNRGFMISVAMMGISLGGMILSPFIAWAIASYGWRKAYFILGGVSLLVLIPISGLVIRRTPEEVGLVPFGQGEKVQQKEEKTAFVSNWNATLKEARKTPVLWMFATGAFLILFTSCFMGHMSNYLQMCGFDVTMIASYISVYSIVAIIGKLALGKIYDRFGSKAGILFGGGTFLLFLICFIFVENNVFMLYAAAVSFGFGTCTASISVPIMTTHIFGAKNYSEIYGFISAFTMAGGAIGSPIVGLIYDISGSYKPALVILAVFTAVYIGIMCASVDFGKKYEMNSNKEE